MSFIHNLFSKRIQEKNVIKILSTVALNATLLLMVGCGTSQYGGATSLCDPAISKLGPDTYYARGSCSGANYGISAANVFCNQRGQNSLVKNITGDDVMFRCLSANDPEYRRPDYEKSPNVIIQDNRKR